jgi:hypothetical protein
MGGNTSICKHSQNGDPVTKSIPNSQLGWKIYYRRDHEGVCNPSDYEPLYKCVTNSKGQRNNVLKGLGGSNHYLSEDSPKSNRCTNPEVTDTNTNTNRCVELMVGTSGSDGLVACQDTLLGLDCCSTMQKMTTEGCWENPTVKMMLTAQEVPSEYTWLGQDNYQLTSGLMKTGCQTLNLAWDWRAPSAEDLATYNNGCGGNKPLSDLELENQRFVSAGQFSLPFTTAGKEECFNYDVLKARMTPFLTDDFTANVAYGVGTYEGLDNSLEYLGIFWKGLNHGFWTAGDTKIDSGEVRFSSDGKKILLSGESDGGFWWEDDVGTSNCFNYDSLHLAQEYEFKGCDTKISKVKIPGTPEFSQLAQKFYETASLFDKWGVEDICMTHEKYCTGTSQQYASQDGDNGYKTCMAYLNSIPPISKACAKNQKILQGDSQTCRFKHHFMVPLKPETHCMHIGPQDGTRLNTMPGMEDHLHKCNDDYECDVGDSGEWYQMTNWDTDSEGNKVFLRPTQEAVDCATESNKIVENVWKPNNTWIGPKLC